jgi:RNA polymerase sigma-70 factor (ECF subfamily)
MTDREYNECVRVNADRLYRFILKNTRSVEDSEDVVQSAFEKMWANRASVDALRSKAFLFRVAYNEMIDQIRKKRKPADMVERHCSPHSNDNKRHLETALSRLTPLQRSLILLKDWEGYSYEEIGPITGLNTLQVKVYLHRARLQVRNFLGADILLAY